VSFSLAAALFLAVLPVSPLPPPDQSDPPGATPKPGSAAVLPGWWSRVNAGAPGAFPAPRPFKADYRITWEGVEAADFSLECMLGNNGSEISTLVKVQTTGIARALWKFDATHLSVVDKQKLKPIRLEQTEEIGRKESIEHVDFTPQSAVHTGYDHGPDIPDRHRSRRYDYPGLFDMESAFLYMRSLPLAVGQTATLALMTAGSPYLATITVVGKGKVQVKAGEFPAFEYSLSLEKITKYGTLEPRKGFKDGHAWISDDANRLILKVQADVFVGAVTAELESVQFTDQPGH
jgi:hypothetical protein